jgi:hypothetical protein
VVCEETVLSSGLVEEDASAMKAARAADREVPVRAEVGSLAGSDRTGVMARVVGRELGLT